MRFKTLFLSLILAASLLLSFNSYANCDPDFDVFCEPNNQGYGTNSNQNNASISTAQATLSKAFDAYSKEDYETAFQIIKPLAEQGSAQAQYRLGVLYSQGKGVEQDYTQAVYWYRKAVNQGYANAQYNLAFAYTKGEGVEQDDAQAVYWYRKAANQGDAKAQNNLGLMYDNGTGVEQDYTQAVYWYRKAVNQGYAQAQNNLGLMYDNGTGVEQDYTQAVYWYRKAANQGDKWGQNNLGLMYSEGVGVEQDYTQAVYWYKKAANQGNASAQNNLGLMYAIGKGVAKNMNTAAYWIKKAKDKGGKKAIKNWAKYNLGQYTAEKGKDETYQGSITTTEKLPTLKDAIKDHKAKDYKSAFSKFLRLAKAGDKSSQGWLGWMYREGEGVEQDDTQAVYWYRKAANQGYDYAQYNLAQMYRRGRGVEQDDTQAVYWYRKAANQGGADAQYNLGWMYMKGRGVEQDDTQAVYWYRKAANQGDATAQHNLGWMYRKGKGVEQDDTQAVYWYRKAANQGDANAQHNLGWMYDEGIGIEKNYKQAFKWYKKAADQGKFTSQNNLGVMYMNGYYVTKNMNKAAYWIKKAKDQGDEIAIENWAKYNLGQYTAEKQTTSKLPTLEDAIKDYEAKDYKKAFSKFLRLAKAGDKSSQGWLGWMYREGEGVEQDDTQAVYWYRKAANQGYDYAQYTLGLMYDEGRGVEKDYRQAFKWYKKAAYQENASAQNNLGLLYDKGEGVEQDYTQAVYWYKKAANQGNASAHNNLGLMYAVGRGVAKNMNTAAYWIKKAKDKGRKKAIKNWVEYNLGQYTAENQTNKKLPALEEAFKSHKAKDYVGELQGLFGIKLNKNINNYVSKTYLYKNKSKHKESKNGFFDVNMTGEIPNKSPYFDKYFIVIDNNNRVHEIYGSKSIASLDACLSQMETLKDSFRSQYQLSFGYDEKGYSTETSDHKTYINSVYTDNDDYLSLQCNLRHNDNSVISQAILRTKKLSEAVDNFYFSALKPFSNKDNTATSQGSDITTKLPTLKDAIKDHKAKDYKNAFGKFLKLAKTGDAIAQGWLGAMYINGTGIEKDAEQAFKWWTKSAKQGDAYSQYNLGMSYFAGDGVKKDTEKGLMLIAKSAKQGYDRAKDFLDKLKKNPIASSGTGFVVARNGVIATAEHVVDGCKRIEVDNLEASIVVADKKNDIALIKVNKTYQDIANIKVRSPKLGMDVMAFGYPLSDTLSSTHISVTKGSVSSLSGFHDDTTRFRYTAPSQPGNSGGPIVNDRGRVIGVVSAVMKNDKDSEINRQNVNIGIRSSLLVSLMESKNIPVATKAMSKGEIIPSYQKVTKYIQCVQANDSQ